MIRLLYFYIIIMSRSERIKQFTEESLGITLPTTPRALTREEVMFVVRMNVEELQELLMTVKSQDEDVKNMLLNIVRLSSKPTFSCDNMSDIEIIANQVDAFVDIDYYNGNAAAKAGMNMDDVFDVVHHANMNKRFDDGTFHRNELGKVIKPPCWKEPDVNKVVEDWINKCG